MKVGCTALTLALTCSALAAPAAKGRPKVLIAFEKTRFKSELVDAMEKKLEAAGAEVETMMHSKKGLAAKTGDYDAVFITNSGVNSKVRPWIVEWLEANKQHKSRVLLHTTQTRDWKVMTDVDAVTSASSRKDVDTLAADYVARLRKILEK